MDDLERQIAAHTQRIAEISNEQGRLRENMKIAGQGSQYYERLLGKLNEQESEIERLQRERTDLSGQRDSARRDFEQFVSTLTIR
jgi:predicted  nucleic acid-binding Zn-ribbon protein